MDELWISRQGSTALTYKYVFSYLRIFDNLEYYPWIKSLEHLKRVNKYRKRVGQSPIVFDDDDMAELILLKGGD